MGETLKHSPDVAQKPQLKQEKRAIASLAVSPVRASLEQLDQLMTSIHIKEIPNARGGSRWEILSFITKKGESVREVRKTRDGAIRRALDRALESHEQILIKDRDDTVVERIRLEKPKKGK